MVIKCFLFELTIIIIHIVLSYDEANIFVISIYLFVHFFVEIAFQSTPEINKVSIFRFVR